MPKTKANECSQTMESRQIPGHIHTCTGRHMEEADCYCGECNRFWKKESE